MIQGIYIKKVKKHIDEGGFFAELVKSGEKTFHQILQTSYSEVKPSTIKAFHIHDYQESFCVIKGRAKVVLYDMRPQSPTKGKVQVIYTGEDNMKVIAIPGEVAHGYKVLGRKTMGIIYHSSEAYNSSKARISSSAYNPKNKTIREIPFDDPTINFDWSKN